MIAVTFHLLPEHRRHFVAVQAVQDAPGLLRVHQAAIDVARLHDGCFDRGAGDRGGDWGGFFLLEEGAEVVVGVWGPFGVPCVTFGDVVDVCMSISFQKGVPEALGAGFTAILMIFKCFWDLFFVFLGGCRGGQNSVLSRRNACFCIFALPIQVAKNLTKKRTSPC